VVERASVFCFALKVRRVKTPTIAPDAWVAPGATVVGDVELQAKSSVWFGAVIRAENDHVSIGEGCNIQDGTVIHIDPGFPLTLHKNVTVGHKVMLHGCTVHEQSLIGIGSIDEEKQGLLRAAEHYVSNADHFKNNLTPIDQS